MVRISDQQSSMLLNMAASGEVIWHADDGDERYHAILDLEDAGLVSAPIVERSEHFKWRLTSRGRTAIKAVLVEARPDQKPSVSATTMTDRPEPAATDYDALQAVGRRLGTPIGRQFFDRHIEMLTRAFGSNLVLDLQAVLTHHDEQAAHRVCRSLCPATTFTLREEENSISVVHDTGITSGLHVVDSDPFFSLSRAVALVSASTQLTSDMRALTEAQAPAAEPVRLAA